RRDNEANRDHIECPRQPSISLRANGAVTIMVQHCSRLCARACRKCDLWDVADRKCALSPAESFAIGSMTPQSSDYGRLSGVTLFFESNFRLLFQRLRR